MSEKNIDQVTKHTVFKALLNDYWRRNRNPGDGSWISIDAGLIYKMFSILTPLLKNFEQSVAAEGSKPLDQLWDKEKERDVHVIVTGILATPDSSKIINLLHVLWTKAVGTPSYDKREWQVLENLLHRMNQMIPDRLP